MNEERKEGEGGDAFVTVKISRELLAMLSEHWSEPVTVTIIPPNIGEKHHQLIATRHECKARQLTQWVRVNESEPLDAVDCWCTGAHIDAGDVVEYCPRHGDEPNWSLIDDPADRQRQREIREANK